MGKFTIGQTVEIVDTDAVVGDEHLEQSALAIISSNNYKGKVTKIVDDIYFVGFKNNLGWVTQGYKENEIRGVE